MNTIKKNKKKHKRGFSLVEVMISVALFSILSVVLGVILNIGLKSWKEVNAKTESERDLNRAINDINVSIRNSMLSYITCDNLEITCNGNGYIICPSCIAYQSAGDDETYTILENEFDIDIYSDTTSSENDTIFIRNFNQNFWIVYCVLKNSKCDKCASMFGSDYSGICPHRNLVKKWYRSASLNSSIKISNLTAVWGTSGNDISTLLETSFEDYLKHNNYNDKVLSRNILAFASNKSSYNVSYYMKMFKPNLNKFGIDEQKISSSIDYFYKDVNRTLSTEQDPLKNYCLEVHSKVVPLNK